MIRLAMLLALSAFCDTWTAHPVTLSAITGGAMIGAGALMIDDGHPVAGGVVAGASAGVAAVAIVLGLIIDNFNDDHARRVCR